MLTGWPGAISHVNVLSTNTNTPSRHFPHSHRARPGLSAPPPPPPPFVHYNHDPVLIFTLTLILSLEPLGDPWPGSESPVFPEVAQTGDNDQLLMFFFFLFFWFLFFGLGGRGWGARLCFCFVLFCFVLSSNACLCNIGYVFLFLV